MLILFVLLIALLLGGLGFALHFLWFLAAVVFCLWIIGYVVGRGQGNGRHHFYRW
jgi:hypothetical protein